jgi:hypothetical protein
VRCAWRVEQAAKDQRHCPGAEPLPLRSPTFTLLEEANSLEPVEGQDGDKEHDQRCENTGEGSTHPPSTACPAPRARLTETQ